MTIEDIRGIGYYTLPGYGEPEPLEPVSTRDPQEWVDKCLDCPLEKCRNDSPACLLNGGRQGKDEKVLERDGRVRDLINKRVFVLV